VNIVLWIFAGVLAAVFLLAGTMKVAVQKEKLLSTMAWAKTWPEPRLKALGAVEVLGAIGLILPAATGIAPVLTPIAAAGLAVMTALAAAMHIRRREPRGVVVTALLLVLAVLVAWGRFGPYGW
jgi:uncharacterized membrane protein YphA (DoxX/SURF4 family)